MFIGNVEIPIVTEVIDGSEAEVEEIKPLHNLDSVPVKHEPSVQEITITGFLNPETHSNHLSLDKQKDNVKALRGKDKLDNDFTYKKYKGYLLVENVDFSDNSDSRIVNEVEVQARYFPWPKYFPDKVVHEKGDYGYGTYGGGTYGE